MIKVPIEIVCLDKKASISVKKIITLLNSIQESFYYSYLDNCFDPNNLSEKEKVVNTEVYEYLDNLRRNIKGYHPNLIAIVPGVLFNKKGNAYYGTVQRFKDHATGRVVISTWGVSSLLGMSFIDLYVLFYLFNYSIRLLVGDKMTHKEERYCIYDGIKKDLLQVMRYGTFCLECNNVIRSLVNELQMKMIRDTLGLISDLSYSDDPITKIDQMITEIKQEPDDSELKESFNEIKTGVEYFISKGEIMHGLEKLSIHLKNYDNSFYNELLQLSSRFNLNRYRFRNGIVTDEANQIEYNKISFSLLEILSRIEEHLIS